MEFVLRGAKIGIVNAICHTYYNSTMKHPASQHQAGMTLSEVMIAVLLFAGFCGSIFELNAVCLRYIDASKESVAALESVHDRCELLRNLAFTDLTNTSTVQSLLATAANASDFGKKATEVVRIRAYPTPNGISQFTRTPDGTVTTNSTATDLGTALVQVDVSTSWNMTLGGRPRSEQTSTIISNGSKK
jgi:Tfp pilus assembly protein PilV